MHIKLGLEAVKLGLAGICIQRHFSNGILFLFLVVKQVVQLLHRQKILFIDICAKHVHALLDIEQHISNKNVN